MRKTAFTLPSKGPVDFHCHGIGKYDFTDLKNINLHDINNLLQKRNHRSILTLYLFRENLTEFLEFMQQYEQAKKENKYQHIAGIALEGPLLASHGGTPKRATWQPNKEEWQSIANCGKQGLVYVILSPDVDFSKHLNNINEPHNMDWIYNVLLNSDVLPAPGHFVSEDPTASARSLVNLFDTVAAAGKSPTITDHFLNDMPHNFKHAWRTPKEQLTRNEDLKDMNLSTWMFENIKKVLGEIPAIFIHYARKGVVKICQNFDGEHVDLSIAKKMVELVGAENMLMMTDSIESHTLAGKRLHMQAGSTLLYQEDGIVAAGSQSVEKQLSNMRKIGLTEKEILLITQTIPESILHSRQIRDHNRRIASSF